VEEWGWVINSDLRGVFLCLKYEIPLCTSMNEDEEEEPS
jgi:hypothetical protein